MSRTFFNTFQQLKGVESVVEDENTIEWVKIIVLDDDLRPS